MAIWDDVMPSADKNRYVGKAGQGKGLRYGISPAIIVVDMTNAFVYDRYPLGNEEQGRPCVRATGELLAMARPLRVPVFYTVNRPFSTPTLRGHWKMSPEAVETMKLHDAHEIVSEIAPREEDLIIEKSKPSAFFGTPLIHYLIYNKVDTVIVTGMTTAGCVRATVIDAFSYDFAVIVPEECVADRGALSHKVSLFDMHMRYADVLPLQEVIAYLSSPATYVEEPRS